MHRLHDYVATLLADKIRSRRVVVWYDEPGEFAPFVSELRGGPRTSDAVAEVTLNGETIHLAEYAGSMFELRTAIEPHVSVDSPGPVVIYVLGCARDPRASVLMELEKAGTPWAPRLLQLARILLLKQHTLGTVDAMLSADRKLGYGDLAQLAAHDGPHPPSVLRAIFIHARHDEELLASWIGDAARDDEIVSKVAAPELVALVRSLLGLELREEAEISKLRAVTVRYVLAGEFRSDLSCPPPATLDGIPTPPTQAIEGSIRSVARRLRTSHKDAYLALADLVEDELGLGTATLPAGALGSIDTFRFEERELLRHCGDLIAASQFDEALAIVGPREGSFWLDVDVARKSQWEAARRMAELGRIAEAVRVDVSRASGDARTWVDRYTADAGWCMLDQAQRRLEAWVTKLDDVPDRPLGVVRRAYEDTCHQMAEGFTKALASSGWAIPTLLHQTRIFSEVVSAQPKPVAYFFVDAMRYEMGLELGRRLETSEVSVRPALAALPSITPVGMAALHPGASASFSVDEQSGRLGSRIDDVFLPDLTARKKFAGSRIPNLVDLALDDLLSMQRSKLEKKTEGAQVVIVRSQEIDHAGEAGFLFSGRQTMDMIIDNLALAIRRLARVGVMHAVVTADHGHLFSAYDRDESMRTDAPGGQTVDLHRRCWIGRGGANPRGTVRVPAAALGYVSDLDFIFPTGISVFKAGGDLAFHHGGPSLQELVIPVLTVRTKASLATSSKGAANVAAVLDVTGVPVAVTNRIFTATLALGGRGRQLDLLAAGIQARPILVAGGQQVGAVGMADGAVFDLASECVLLEPGHQATVWFRLLDDDVSAVRIVVLNPATDAELYRSPSDIPVRLGVR